MKPGKLIYVPPTAKKAKKYRKYRRKISEIQDYTGKIQAKYWKIQEKNSEMHDKW